MQETKNLIVDLSSLPCSVIIVGLGKADFSDMEELNAEEAGLTNKDGDPCQRDITTFVEYEKVIKDENLSEAVLIEIPDHVRSYMEMRDKPKEKIAEENQA